MLLSFLIGGDGSFVRISVPSAARAPAPLHDDALEFIALGLDFVPSPEETEGAGRAAVFHARVANRASIAHSGVFTATLSDTRGTAIAGHAIQNGWRLEPGFATEVAFGFSLPFGFVPHHLVIRPIPVTFE